MSRALADHLTVVPQFEILINNTGGPAPGPANTSESSAFLAAFNQHLINNHQIIQRVIGGMKKAGYGRIINVLPGTTNTVRLEAIIENKAAKMGLSIAEMEDV